MNITAFITFLALFSRLAPISDLNPYFSIIFIILAIFPLDWTTGKLRRTLGLATIWPFFGQKWLFFDKMAISWLRNHIFKDRVTFFSSTLREDENKVRLVLMYMAYNLKNGNFLAKNGHFWYFTHHIPHSALGWGQFRQIFFLTFAFFYVRSWHFDTLRFV